MWFGHGFGWGGWIVGGLMMLLFWGGLIALVILAIRAFSQSGGKEAPRGDNPADSALEIVRQRYARGEISEAEFEEMRRDLAT
jgi:putative membrane protein